ncbi:hypothetical protein [Sporomusa sp.]|uniref:hypothetical protein n=1 Tax=Sporomusa sp. TaxID=2078658 RepID=UPI002D0243CF|nr:hypothetical protein [Sporomusa sp.]HWR09447.1 hypothetical protein [Sporomusa sp.]
MNDLAYYWQKIMYLIVHQTTLWLLIVFFSTSLVGWGLGSVLDQHNARGREANFARKTAAFYAAAALGLWFCSFFFS